MSSTNKWPTVKLGEVAEILMGQAPPSSATNKDRLGYPLIAGAGDFSSTGIEPIKFTNVDARLSEADDIIISIRATIGPFRIADRQYALGRGVAAIRACDKVDNSFLAHYIRYSEPALIMKGRGATFLQISRRDLSGLDVPLPPLAEQQRITKILDKIALSNGLKTSMLEKLSELEASMFENLAKQNRSATAPLSSLNVDFIAGKNIVASGESSHPLNQVVKVSAVSSGTFDPTEAKPLPADYSPPEKHRLEKGDILFGRASGSLKLIGATCLVTQDVEHLYLPDKVWKLEVGAESPVDPLFVYYALRGARSRSYFQNQASGASGVRNISKQKVLQLEIPVPSPEDQRSFLNNAAHIREAKLQTKKSLALGEELQDSLSIRAFDGRL